MSQREGAVSDIHITRELLRAVESGELPARMLTEIGWQHLLSLCPACREELDAWRREKTASRNYDTAFKVLPVVLERHVEEVEERQEAARRDLRILLGLPQKERLARIRRASRRFQGTVLAALLLDAAKKAMPARPGEVHELAETATAVLLRTPEVPGLYDLLVRARAYQANALRALGRLTEAAEALQGARTLMRTQGATDPLVFAEVDWIEGALHKDRRHFPAAEELLVRAASFYSLAGEKGQSAEPLLTLGLLYYDTGETRKAIGVTETAAVLLSPEQNPRSYLCARHNLTLFLTEVGEYAAAAEALSDDEDLYRQFSDHWTRLRQVWLKGKVACGLGRLDEAERAFLGTRQGFLDQGVGYDAALASLDLALVYAKQGRASELKELAIELSTIFEADELHREAMGALVLLRKAAEEERVTVGMIEEVAGYLKRVRNEPSLRFRQRLLA
jgi:tetratricopeptide (TPR) repeat protein